MKVRHGKSGDVTLTGTPTEVEMVLDLAHERLCEVADSTDNRGVAAIIRHQAAGYKNLAGMANPRPAVQMALKSDGSIGPADPPKAPEPGQAPDPTKK